MRWYGIVNDHKKIVTTPNEVYGVVPDHEEIVITPNEGVGRRVLYKEKVP